MNYPAYREAGYTVVVLDGEVDLYSSPKARSAILTELERHQPLLVDLAAVSYIDSSGIASLVEGYQLARKRGLVFALIGVKDTALQVIQLARLDKVFPMYTSVEGFVAAQSSRQQGPDSGGSR